MWHVAQDVPKWDAGALWHDAHAFEEGCVAAQEVPGLLWHVAHETVRLCPAGALWHDAHADDVCRNTALANATPGEWHEAHAEPKCFAGAAWHDAHADEAGCENAHEVPGRRWHDAQGAAFECPAGAA